MNVTTTRHPTMRTSAVPGLSALALALFAAPALAQTGPPPLESIRNYTWVSDDLASAGQIANDQIPLLVEAGYDVVVNLAIADVERNGEEGFRVAEAGLAYIHIPVDWQEPTLDDLDLFFDVMEANEGRKVFVHCFANMRASAFVYLYRTMVQGVADDVAGATMSEVWDPAEVEQWGALIERARARGPRGG